MLWRMFGSHPASVGETYCAHMAKAFGFGIAMVTGGFACLVHAVFPSLFTRTGSEIIRDLHDRMVVNRISAAGSQKAE